ncbi:MAG TPA: BON domain-containing protein [Vicinamibacterales bacterium]|nr:BON domain-containing protein [Vicinamibacterales bacterium]
MYQRFAILLSAGALAFTVACSHTDTGITSAVKSKMAADDTVKASEINVDTHNHVVTLNGTVGSKAERDRAVMIARNTKGVNSVIDDLRVGPVATSGSADRDRDYSESAEQTARDAKEKTESTAHDAKVKSEHATEKTGEVISDAAITSTIKTKFLAESGVPGTTINVDTNNHVVTLTGTVKTKAEAAKAVSIARETKGVKRVVDHLKVAA